jgi:hypothetical protein
MVSNKRLGIYWGETAFYFVETSRSAPALATSVPFLSGDTPDVHAPDADVDFLEVLQRNVRNKGFSTVETYLSLPSKDILIRWFLIPWVKTSEIQDVVAFAVRKHIPFDIKELTYTYYPSNVMRDGVRQIGILFVAIRKDLFQNYVNVLTQAGLNVVYCEPGPMSLLRALVHKHLVKVDQVTAVLRTAHETAELFIASGGYVKFIRDFRIQALGGTDEDVVKARIFNDVRVSFDFFARQYGEAGVSDLVVLSSTFNRDFWTGLDKEVGARVEVIDPARDIAPMEGMSDGGANAFGVAISGNVASVVDFNLSEGAPVAVAPKREEVLRRNKELVFPALVGVFCAALILLALYLCDQSIRRTQADYLATAERVGIGMDMTPEDLDSKTADAKKKLAGIKSLPLAPRVMPLLARLSKRLPRGVWLDNIAISFSDSSGSGGGVTAPVYAKITTSASLSFSGNIFLDSKNAEFEAVNAFVTALNKDKEFQALFSSVKLLETRAGSVAGFKVTTFKVACEAR